MKGTKFQHYCLIFSNIYQNNTTVRAGRPSPAANVYDEVVIFEMVEVSEVLTPSSSTTLYRLTQVHYSLPNNVPSLASTRGRGMYNTLYEEPNLANQINWMFGVFDLKLGNIQPIHILVLFQ